MFFYILKKCRKQKTADPPFLPQKGEKAEETGDRLFYLMDENVHKSFI